MELLAVSPHVRFVNEPDIPDLVFARGLPTGLEELPPHFRKLVAVPSASEGRFVHHFTNYATTRIRGPYNLFAPQYHLFTNRRLLKIVHATGIADWLTSPPLLLRPIYLARHPLATALSMLRSNVTLRAEANLLHPDYCSRHLNNSLVDFSWRVLRQGSELEAFVLEWCLDNLVPYRLWSSDPAAWAFTTYEELTTSPAQSLRVLGPKVGIPITDRMISLARVPSASTSIDRRRLVQERVGEASLMRWKDYVTDEAERRAFDIVRRFGIELYEYGSGVVSPLVARH